jgi:hypothetical protein
VSNISSIYQTSLTHQANYRSIPKINTINPLAQVFRLSSSEYEPMQEKKMHQSEMAKKVQGMLIIKNSTQK